MSIKNFFNFGKYTCSPWLIRNKKFLRAIFRLYYQSTRDHCMSFIRSNHPWPFYNQDVAVLILHIRLSGLFTSVGDTDWAQATGLRPRTCEIEPKWKVIIMENRAKSTGSRRHRYPSLGLITVGIQHIQLTGHHTLFVSGLVWRHINNNKTTYIKHHCIIAIQQILSIYYTV